MSEDQSLGRLRPVNLRDVWKSESEDFSPWLAKDANLAVLCETLGMQLEVVALERDVGPFRVDIHCRDVDKHTDVLIENQLEKANHGHLGQLLTYAAGLDAVTMIWIAAKFTKEHRAALDWLNEITEQRFRFFGLEVELWQIGNSLAAPKFNMVSKPDDWPRPSRRGRPNENEEWTPAQLMQIDYWEGLKKALKTQGGVVQSDRRSFPKSSFRFKLGRSGFSLWAGMSIQKKRITAEIYIRAVGAKSLLERLQEDREEIEKEIEGLLVWKNYKKNAGVVVVLDDADLKNRDDWSRQHVWLAKTLNDLHRAFADRVKKLDIDDRDGLETDEESEDEQIE